MTVSQTRHQQTAVEDERGWWQVQCECGAKGRRRATNFQAWTEPIEHAEEER